MIAATTAVLFTIHPLNAENLSHITFSTVFFSAIFLHLSLLGFWKYLSSTNPNKNLFYLSLISFLLALMFLETAWLFPGYLSLLCLLKPIRERARILLLSVPFWALSVAYFIVWCFMTQNGNQFTEKVHHLDISVPGYIATLGLLFKWYMGNLFFPDDPVFIKSSAVLTSNLIPWICGVAASLGMILWLIYLWRKTPKGFAILWFLIGFVFMFPASLIHAYSMGMVIEPNWFFFSSGGFFMLLALVLADLKPHVKPLLSRILFAVIVFFWIITSYRHHLIARTEVSYLEYWLKISPGNSMPSLRLATLYGLKDDLIIPEHLIPAMELQVETFIKTEKYGVAAILLNKLLICQPQNQHNNIWKYTLKALDVKIEKIVLSQMITDFQSERPAAMEYVLLASQLERMLLREPALTVLDLGLSGAGKDHSTLILLKALILANQNRFEEAEGLLQNEIPRFPQDQELAKMLKEIQNLKNSQGH